MIKVGDYWLQTRSKTGRYSSPPLAMRTIEIRQCFDLSCKGAVPKVPIVTGKSTAGYRCEMRPGYLRSTRSTPDLPNMRGSIEPAVIHWVNYIREPSLVGTLNADVNALPLEALVSHQGAIRYVRGG